MATLLRWREQGLTHQQMAERIEKETGYPVSRSTVSAMFSRYGETTQPLHKYTEEVPWRVRQEHATHYAVRMLRLLGRKRAGEVLTPANEGRLNTWLRQLEDIGAVVVYVPDTDEGFFYVAGEPDAPGLPIRKDWRGI